jgi:c(7)-type cytochrome triheme protein
VEALKVKKRGILKYGLGSGIKGAMGALVILLIISDRAVPEPPEGRDGNEQVVAQAPVKPPGTSQDLTPSPPVRETKEKGEVSKPSVQKGTGVPDRQEADRRRLIEKFKHLDPAMAIYLDNSGQLAGTGDPGGVVGEAERAGMAKHPVALEVADLPTDQYGLVDWVEAVRTGKVKPRDSLDPAVPPTEPLDLDIVIETKSRFQPRDVFSHKVHTYWLGCNNCHPAIFKQKAGGNPEMTMPKIAAGEYCGKCHNRVSFPLTDCLRCHIKPKEATTAGPATEAPAPLR